MTAYTNDKGEEIQPLRGLVLLRPFELCDNYQTVGGVVLPDNIDNWIPPQQGEVIAFGPGASHVEIGDVVVYGLGAGFDTVIDGKLALVLDESEIIGKVWVH